MLLNEDSLSIVTAMGNDYLPSYKKFRDGIARQLDTTISINDDDFPSHGYDHCVRIFQHLDNLLGQNEPFIKDIQPQELFCLSLAILWHDLIMTIKPSLRKTHAKEAKDTIRNEFEKQKNYLFLETLHDSVIDAIADIVMAHSDCKDEKNNIMENTLYKVKDNTESGPGGKIRTYILAALLRFGDELDCTSARTNDCQRAKKEKNKNNSHWRKCELIRSIQPPGNSQTDIILKVNDIVFNSSDDKENDLKLIKEVITKLKDSLKEVNDIIFKPHEKITWWHYNTVKLAEDSQEIVDPLVVDILATATVVNKVVVDRPLLIPSSRVRADPLPQKGSSIIPIPSSDVEAEDLRSADMEISKKLYKWVIEEKMLQSGHFRISKERHARDWINTSRLLEEEQYAGPIAKSFIEILRQRDFSPKNTFLIGEGFPGLIIASQIGFLAGYGCTYILPVKDGEDQRENTRWTDIPEQENIVLVTDVVAKADTLVTSLQYLNSKHITAERVIAILCVFHRKPRSGDGGSLSPDNRKKLIPLNIDFPIQLCEMPPDRCLFYKNNLVDIINEDLWREP